MPIDSAKIVFFKPNGLRKFKSDLFDRVGGHIERRGGRMVRGDVAAMANIPADALPIVGCMPELTEVIHAWVKAKREWAYWDRGYARRVFATWLPRGENGGYYRWTRNAFQMQTIRETNATRWAALNTPLQPWKKNGRHVVIACPTPTFAKFHRIEGWTIETIQRLSELTDRQLIVREKTSKRPLQHDLDGAHCLVAHASIAAVESAILGCPVFVDKSSAASLVGLTDLTKIDRPIYPDREPWAWSLADGQYNEAELINGTLWNLLA